ncbi:uncharacterized protein LOC100838108 [Brachypodium distachyon]|uniref:F-box protein AT5G49610-like beta-propeller domain-containing protein n=1 Tax=Brachypodium distachyon TaxID=15368 RepID=I1HXG8_BRADI|nr:uncharacterized protein LOC100838108 [Brachypodium distachyon]KQJ93442.1 hypothetical protein BRADI_3g04620v3 [Brachypodium distachyon]|eukprot:XP_003574968.1 uncharacterized protein LOC100838108 [Brachypodium distachyon]
MASPQPPAPPPAESPPPPAPTTVLALGEDLLREIFVRLPSLPSLVRAAFTCHAFLDAVRSSPAFRRRFREDHPQPLLGFFFDPDGPAIPSFAPLRRRDEPDLAAAICGADFFLTRLPDEDDASPGWSISDCHDGYVLFYNSGTGQFAAFNPIARALDLIPPTPDEIFDGCHGPPAYLDGCIVFSGEAGGPFRLVNTCYDDSRARAAVFSSESREWEIFPWSEPMTEPGEKYWLKGGTMVNGSIYWVHTTDAYMLVLDTATLQFSQMDLPACLAGQDYLFRVGEAKDGKLCIVCPIEFKLLVWVWRSDDDGTKRWMLDNKFHLETIVDETEGSLEEHGELHIVATVDGVVYFTTSETFIDPHFPSWFLSLCLETAELDTVFQKRYDSHVHPYIMAWPPSLVQNKVCPQLEDA